MNIWYAGTLVVSWAMATLLTYLVKKIALQRNWVGQAMPHHFHDGPIPRLGGISIFVTVLILSSVLLSVRGASIVHLQQAVALFCAGILVFAVGLWDDFSPISPLSKALLEMLSGGILYAGHIRIETLAPFYSGPLPWFISFLLTIGWVLGITNAFNLIDGLDGLAAGSGLISSVVLAVMFALVGRPELALASLIIAGALLGFLKFNFSPAGIFLGDCGSLFIGFLMSTLGLMLLNSPAFSGGIIVPILAFGLPVLDTVLAITRRILKGQPVYMPDCEHMHHKLVARGFSVPGSAFALYGISAFLSLTGILLASTHAHYFAVSALPLSCVAVCFVGFGYHRCVKDAYHRNEPISITYPEEQQKVALAANASSSRQPVRGKPIRKSVKDPQYDELVAAGRSGQATRVAFSDD